jgi:hypothetical protein
MNRSINFDQLEIHFTVKMLLFMMMLKGSGYLVQWPLSSSSGLMVYMASLVIYDYSVCSSNAWHYVIKFVSDLR